MFGSKNPDAPRPLNDSGRSQISETFSLEGTLRTSGAIDIAGLIKGAVYTNDLIIKETGSILGPVETDKIEIYGHLEGKVVARTIVIGSTAIVKGDILKAATWSAPAKHSRGSIFDKEMHKSFSWTGPNYL